jgi:hypothetical protein
LNERKNNFLCPNCGGYVPGGALACPDCGSDEETGWSEDTMYDDLDLPTAAHLQNLDAERDHRSARKQLFWSIVTVVLIGTLMWMILRGLW